ncbi:MAG: GlsB/YeaQ/YmgE family stress response membrane protein [Hasllibacter sp.]
MGIGWFTFLIVGLLAGWIAEKIMKRDHGLLTNLIVGVVGAYLGAFLVGLFVDGDAASGFISALVVSVIGACALLAALSLIRGKPVR